MLTFDINSVIGNLHDAAMLHAERMANSWKMKLTTMNGGYYLRNEGIVEGTDHEGSKFKGPGIYSIIMIRNSFLGEARAKKFMSEYLKYFMGIDQDDIDWKSLKRGKGSLFGTKYWVLDYEIKAKNLPEKKTKIKPDKDMAKNK